MNKKARVLIIFAVLAYLLIGLFAAIYDALHGFRGLNLVLDVLLWPVGLVIWVIA